MIFMNVYMVIVGEFVVYYNVNVTSITFSREKRWISYEGYSACCMMIIDA